VKWYDKEANYAGTHFYDEQNRIGFLLSVESKIPVPVAEYKAELAEIKTCMFRHLSTPNIM
jgi:hypothetical protein